MFFKKRVLNEYYIVIFLSIQQKIIIYKTPRKDFFQNFNSNLRNKRFQTYCCIFLLYIVMIIKKLLYIYSPIIRTNLLESKRLLSTALK